VTGPAPHGYRGRPAEGPPGHPRLFIAIPIPEVVAARIGDLVEGIQGELGQAAGRVRWVQMEGLHVTLRFLGPTPPERVEQVGDAVAAVARTEDPFEVRIGGAGAFPEPRRPRALWLGIRAGAEELGRISAALTAELEAIGWALEDRPFRPHLTIARTDGVHAGAEAGHRLVAAAAELDLAFEASQVVLYQSHLGRGPARYQQLRAAPLR
jgi:2'-5' RNA ligase